MVDRDQIHPINNNINHFNLKFHCFGMYIPLIIKSYLYNSLEKFTGKTVFLLKFMKIIQFLDPHLNIKVIIIILLILNLFN